MSRTDLFVGLMTGTSLHGADAVLADCAPRVPRTLAHVHQALPGALRAELLALNAPGNDEIHRSHLAAQELARCYADAVTALLRDGGVGAREVRAIGAHGQRLSEGESARGRKTTWNNGAPPACLRNSTRDNGACADGA